VPLEPGPSGSVALGALLLLDLVDLRLPQTPSGSGPGGSEEGDDEEEEEGGDGALSAGAGLRRLRLLGSKDCPQMLCAAHASGLWSVSLSWLQPLARALGARGVERAAATGAPRLSEQDLWQVQVALETVPPPAVHELLSLPGPAPGAPAPAQLAAAAMLNDIFVGDSVLLLQLPSGPGGVARGLLAAAPASAPASAPQPVLRCLRLRPESSALPAPDDPDEGGAAEELRALSLASSPTAQPSAGEPSAFPSGSSEQRASSSGSQLSAARQSLLEGNIKAIYGDLQSAFSPLTLPEPTGEKPGFKNTLLNGFKRVTTRSHARSAADPDPPMPLPQAPPALRTQRARSTSTTASAPCASTTSSTSTGPTRSSSSGCNSWSPR
jgi:hypothetical protein